MARIGISSPWVVFYRKVEAFFKKDPEVHVLYDEEKNEVILYVDNSVKAAAIDQILVHEKVYGNVTLKLKVIPANGFGLSKGFLFQNALDKNPALSYIKTVRGVFSNDLTYIVFACEVVQYYNDDLGDIHGICSTLCQDIANDIFEPAEGVFYCTDIKEDGALGIPLGEWP